MSILYLEKCKASSFHAAMAAVVMLIMITVSCNNNGELSKSEQKEFDDYREAISHALDSSQYEKLLKLCKEFYEVSQKGHSELFHASAASAYGQWLVMLDNPDEGKKFLDESLALATKYDNDTLLYELYAGLGLYEEKNRNYYASSEYFLKSLEYARRCGGRSPLAILCNLGNSLSSVKDTTGLKYLQEAYEVAKDSDIPHDMMDVAHCMAYHMKMRGNMEEELKWKQIYMENLPKAQRMASENMTKAEISLIKKKDEEALRYIDIAVAAADSTKNIQPGERKDIYLTKATILYELGRYQESLKWLNKESELYKNNNDSKWLKKLRLCSMIYEKLGDHAKALEYQKKLIEAIEENANVDRINILKAKEVALDVAQKDDEIAQHKEHARMLKWLLGAAVAFCLLLAGLSLFIYNMYNKQRKLMTVVVERAQPETVTIEQKQMDDKHVELFRRMKEEIDDNKMFLDPNLSRESLAKHLGTNRTYISEAIAKMTGMNFPQYINLLRINEAERRLHDPQVDVSNFANLGSTLGFASLNAFRTAFKQQTGMTLSAYREIARKRPTPALPG